MNNPTQSKKRSNSSASSTQRRVKNKSTLSSILPTPKPKATAVVTTLKKGRRRNKIAQIQTSEAQEPPPCSPTAAPSQEMLDSQEHGSGATAQVGSEKDADWEDVGTPTKAEKKAQRRFAKAANKVREWLPHRDKFLNELVRHEGTAGASLDKCGGCEKAISSNESLYRCTDCIDGANMRCVSCARTMHSNLPYHRLTRWTGTHFAKCGTIDLELCFQLGHDGKSFCAHPSDVCKLLVLHSSGVCHIRVQYCDCETAPDRVSQLLRSRLFPATIERTQTAFTFELLDWFQELNLQGKTPSYDFYHTLLRQSDLLRLGLQTSQLNNLNLAIRLWRHLQSLKRAGRAHDPQGVSATKLGELMVECPACPHPGKNLPDDWQLATTLAFLYTLYLAIDANFKLKGKDRGLEDIELAPGWGAFVEELAYQAHLGPYIADPEINSCESEHDAVVRAAVRCTPGYNVTGAGLVICSRHCLIRPNGAGDLQKGERYCNMDYIVFSAFMALALLRVVITYDIACQWSWNYRQRLSKLPEALRPAENIQIDTAIPSWHINGHGKKCQDTMHTGYLNGVGRLCGDEVEQTWWSTNPLGVSVREMGPALRHEVLNNQWNAFNIMKIRQFREQFAKKLKTAVKSEATHAAVFAKLSLDYPPSIRQEWDAMISDFDKDKTKPSPYEEKSYAVTYDEVRARIAAEEKVRTEQGQAAEHKTSMLTFLTNGLELEEKQRLLKEKIDRLPKAVSPRKDTEITERRTTLLRQIMAWRKVQQAYMPNISDFVEDRSQDDSEGSDDIEAEESKLWLPSALPAQSRQSINRIANSEAKLREAQAYDAISKICRIRRVMTGVTTFKRFNLAGEGNTVNTKMRTLYNGLQTKIDRAAKRYIATRNSLLVLEPTGAWQEDLKELVPREHIKGPNKDDGDSHGKHVPSWIWLTRKGAHKLSEAELEESINSNAQAEWSQARARAMRWKEEVQLVQEEMRRTVVYLFWKAKWWEDQSGAKSSVPDDIRQGLAGYAAKQAWYCRQLADSSLACWKPVLVNLRLSTKWMEQWNIPNRPPKKGKAKGKDDKDEDDDDNDSSGSEFDITLLQVEG